MKQPTSVSLTLHVKQCTVCNESKELSAFPFDKRRNYHQTVCKACKLAKEAKWRDMGNRGEAYKARTTATQRRTSKVKSYHLSVLVEQQANLCALCGKPFSDSHSLRPSIDHKIPVVKGGSDKLYNLQAVHRRCNNIKGTHSDSHRIRILIQGRGR